MSRLRRDRHDSSEEDGTGGRGGRAARPGGLLGRLTKVVLEGALEGEMDAHLGYASMTRRGGTAGTRVTGTGPKTVLTDVGPVEIAMPSDRDASFAPKIVARRQRRLGGVDDMVISLVAKGLTTGEVTARLAEVYGAEVPGDTISAITGRVLEGLAGWQSRPLDPVYAVLFIDAINVKIRDGQVASRPICTVLGVTADGERDILGLRAGEHGDGEGAKFWLRVLTEIENRGTKDVLMVVCDGLKGLPDAIAQAWPLAAAGVPIVAAPADGPFGRQFAFADPEGYVITVHDQA
jgi:putative transposase